MKRLFLIGIIILSLLVGCNQEEQTLTVQEVAMSLDQVYEVVPDHDKKINEEIKNYGQEDAKAFHFSGGNILYIYQFKSNKDVKKAMTEIDNGNKPNLKLGTVKGDVSLRILEHKNILIMYYPINLNRPFSEQDEKILNGIKSEEELQQFLEEKHEKILEEQKLEKNNKN